MLLTPDFVVLHVPKTGGTFLKRVCAQHLPGVIAPERLKHLGWREIPDEFAHLPRFALVRNPWDWHVSWYSYMRNSPEDAHYPWCRGGFREALTASFDATPALRNHRGLYMNGLYRITGAPLSNPRAEIGRFENLGEDFLSFLDRHAIHTSPAFRHAVSERGTDNASDRGPYRSYYDKDLRQLVAEKTQPVIRRFGYEF